MAYRNFEDRQAYQREYRQKNRDKIAKQKRKYYQKNRDKLAEPQREYYQKNRDKIIERQREYRSRPASREAQKRRGAEWYQVNTEKARAQSMARFHGMCPEDWAALCAAQDGRCYLCGDELDLGKKNQAGPHVEHDHSCCGARKSCQICRRGLACADCNVAIGYAHDDPARLRRMADALEIAQAAFLVRKAAAAAASEQLSFPA